MIFKGFMFSKNFCSSIFALTLLFVASVVAAGRSSVVGAGDKAFTVIIINEDRT